MSPHRDRRLKWKSPQRNRQRKKEMNKIER